MSLLPGARRAHSVPESCGPPEARVLLMGRRRKDPFPSLGCRHQDPVPSFVAALLLVVVGALLLVLLLLVFGVCARRIQQNLYGCARRIQQQNLYTEPLYLAGEAFVLLLFV